MKIFQCVLQWESLSRFEYPGLAHQTGVLLLLCLLSLWNWPENRPLKPDGWHREYKLDWKVYGLSWTEWRPKGVSKTVRWLWMSFNNRSSHLETTQMGPQMLQIKAPINQKGRINALGRGNTFFQFPYISYGSSRFDSLFNFISALFYLQVR